MRIRKISKIIITDILFLGMFFLAVSYAGDASIYKVTVQSIQLKTSSGSWVTIASPNQEIDIASVSAGAVAASLLSDVKIPAGSYVNFKIVLSETMKFSGSDSGFYTKEGGSITLTGDDVTDGSTATWTSDPPICSLTESVETATVNSSEQGEVTAILDLENGGDADNYIEIYSDSDLTTPITVNENSEVSMYFTFDTQGTVNYVNIGGNNIMYFTPPGAGTTFGITIDGVSYSISAADMEIYF